MAACPVDDLNASVGVCLNSNKSMFGDKEGTPCNEEPSGTVSLSHKERWIRMAGETSMHGVRHIVKEDDGGVAVRPRR